MKANEAPEKIYLNWVNYPLEEMQVEYTRTDAFIEKAVKYLKDNVTYIHPRKGTEKCIFNITKFIDHMKGE